LIEFKVLARILLHPSHPSHSASRVNMEVDCAVELTNKDPAILPDSVRVARLQAHKIKKSHLVQSVNHKVVLSGIEHDELFPVDGPGLHKGVVPHELSIAVEVIPEASLSLGPEFPVTTCVGSFLET
jgi:hypothetical protein